MAEPTLLRTPFAAVNARWNRSELRWAFKWMIERFRRNFLRHRYFSRLKVSLRCLAQVIGYSNEGPYKVEL